MASRCRMLVTRVNAPATAVRDYLARPAAQERLALPPFLASARPRALGPEDVRFWEDPKGDSCRIGIVSPAGGPESPLGRATCWRLARIRQDVVRLRLALDPGARIGVSGTHGLIGREVASCLSAGGWHVARFIRRGEGASGEGDVLWQPGGSGSPGDVDAPSLENVGSIVHLAGEPLRVWRAKRETLRAFRESRVEGTRTIARAAASMTKRPKVLVVASGVGFYGDRAEEEVKEDAGVGSGFLAELARDWEAACAPAVEAGIRVVNLRIGIVVGARGGAVHAMLPSFRLGLGCVMGNGRQWWSWIGLDDLVGVILRTLTLESLSGPVNAVSSAPVTAREFAQALARVCDRSLFMSIPALAVRTMFREAGDAALASCRVMPEKLRREGEKLLCPTLDKALRWELGAGAGEEWSVFEEDVG